MFVVQIQFFSALISIPFCSGVKVLFIDVHKKEKITYRDFSLEDLKERLKSVKQTSKNSQIFLSNIRNSITWLWLYVIIVKFLTPVVVRICTHYVL